MHPVAVVLDVLPFGVRRDAMVGTRDVAAQVDQGADPLDLGIDGRVVPGEEVFKLDALEMRQGRAFRIDERIAS